jgi:heat-inducible transcriptional repressor
MLEPRQEIILKSIVDEYIRSAEPVGSRWVAETSGLAVSPATIRNDMAVLEDAGFIAQPHTSAGRVPTEKAYVYYLQHFVEPRRAGKIQGSRIKIQEGGKDQDANAEMRALARTLVELSGEMALVAVDPRQSFYAGVANLMEKPEFGDLSVVRELSRLLDRFDDVMGEVFDRVANEPEVLIGSENPFGRDMSAIMVKCRLPNGQIGILGLLGPLRMDYGRNIGLIEEVREILDE